MGTTDPGKLMSLAMDAARRGTGYVSPNPRVGCVIALGSHVVSVGWHAQFGGPHAEVMALEGLSSELIPGELTLYVTLEPCSHHGKTPPCTDAIVNAGIRNVVIGCIDPNPLVAGRGIDMLKSAGCHVIVGVMEDECKELVRYYSRFITTGRPYTILKIAQSLDGCVSSSATERTTLTSGAAQAQAHALRAECDAILSGAGTVNTDKPMLTVRLQDGRTPHRLILGIPDFDKASPLTSTLHIAPITAFIGKDLATGIVKPFLQAGWQIVELEEDNLGECSIATVLHYAGSVMKLTSILCEAGPRVVYSLLRDNLVDELWIYTAPVFLGNGLGWRGEPTGNSDIIEGKWKVTDTCTVGPDVRTILRKTIDIIDSDKE